MEKHTVNKKALGGILVALGVVYGDIGTSPLYVMKAMLEGNGGIQYVDETYILGAVSLVFWTLTLLTTIKYVLIALKADNHGEGGIFALFTLVKKRMRWLIIPAMLGGAALLADGILTPAVTVTTAIEGLRSALSTHVGHTMSQNTIIIIVIVIISTLFAFQRFGTEKVGRVFGPVMFVWFTTLAVFGIYNLSKDFTIIRALSPTYALQVLFSPSNKSGILILGMVFLSTTGAEALYSDMGHVGRKNIYFTWPYVKVCLVLNYLGQAAWILSASKMPAYYEIEALNPFYEMVPHSLVFAMVILSTTAAIIASQSLITGSYTLVSEAIKLNMLPRMNIQYPTDNKGQVYIPAVNTMLWISCVACVLYFRTSAHMEAAYGLSITVTMLMTTILLYQYMRLKNHSVLVSGLLIGFFGLIETLFFISSLSKFFHGGFVAAFMALAIYAVMYIWTRGNLVMKKAARAVKIPDYIDQIDLLRNDKSLPLVNTNLVYLTSNSTTDEVDYKIMYSLLDRKPKRAKVYWFVNIEVTDKPYGAQYHVDTFDTNYVFKVHLYLGFRMKQHINVYLREIVQELMEQGTIDTQPQEYTTVKGREVGDFAFILLRDELSVESGLSKFEQFIMSTKIAIKRRTVLPEKWFGIQYSETTTEIVPIAIRKPQHIEITQV
ncbi:potassium transporter Kup [Erysipelothrix larvae]|uniref:Probable potassium transport system protein Kup n=1 Tax=Erysipelothrix larvae TaxID=1514105 RepID=A0A0X8H0P5_9FIRM|nr:KUP/HAK/KT family potassium transporter [Erysipelothrix larvae]AMC93940.1 potassium transporter Kup [Erysipelothrix larvae]